MKFMHITSASYLLTVPLSYEIHGHCQRILPAHPPAFAHYPAPPNEYGSKILEIHYFSGVGLLCFGTAASPGGRRTKRFTTESHNEPSKWLLYVGTDNLVDV